MFMFPVFSVLSSYTLVWQVLWKMQFSYLHNDGAQQSEEIKKKSYSKLQVQISAFYRKVCSGHFVSTWKMGL